MLTFRRGLVTLSLLMVCSSLVAQDAKLTPPKEDATPAELLKFISSANRPDLTKVDYELLIKLTDRILQNDKATGDEQKSAQRIKISILFQASRRMAKDFAEAFDKHTAAMADHKDPEVAGMAVCFRWVGKNMSDDGKLNMQGKADLIEVCKKFPKHNLTGSLVNMFAEQIENDKDALAFLKEIEAIAGDSPLGNRVKGLIKSKSIVGSVIEIVGPTIDGTDFNLASLKGKVVLVDFWATWCGPCIAELPNVKAVYEKYHDKGFEIVGVSLDFKKETLANYVKENKMPWKQIIFGKEDEMGWNNPIAQRLGINSIPAMFLIGKDGIVVTRDLRGEGVLEKKVLEELGKPGK